MANVGTAAAGKTLIGAGNGVSPTFASIGTNSGLTNNTFLLAQGNSPFVSAGALTNGQLFIGSAGAAPVAATLTASTGIVIVNGPGSISIGLAGGGLAVEHLTGNTGGILNPTANNFNIVTANSIPSFAGSGSTLTLDFSQTNLSLGTTLPSLSGGVINVIIGGGATGATLTSGSDNVLIGNATATHITSGGSNVFIGGGAGAAATSATQCTGIGIGALTNVSTGVNSRNTAVGYTCLNGITTGASNTGIGVGSGSSLTGTDSSNIMIMHIGVAGDNNTLRLGTDGSASGNINKSFIAAIRSVSALTNAAPVGIDNNHQLCNLGFGTSGQVFTSNGANTTPTFQTPIASTSNFLAYIDSVTNVTGDDTVYTVVWNHTLFDQGSNFNTGSGTFTAPATGRYFFTSQILLNNMSVAYTSSRIQIVTTARNYVNNMNVTSAGSQRGINISCIADMTAGDTAIVQIDVNGSTKSVGIANGAATDLRSYFNGYRVS